MVSGALLVVRCARVGRGDDICVRNCVLLICVVSECRASAVGQKSAGCMPWYVGMPLGAFLAASWGIFRGLLGGSWCLLGASRESPRASGGRLETLWENLGATLGQSARKAWGGPLFWLFLGARAEVLARLDW